MYKETTIAAIATASGAGGIGIIRISGREALTIGEQVFRTKRGLSLSEAEPYRMYFGHVTEGDRIIDEGLAVYMKGPHSYTGEDVVEIQIHGGTEALHQTLALTLSAGAEPAEQGEFTKRAFLNGRLDLSQAEAVADIVEARSEAALSQAESHLSGALSEFVRYGRDLLLDLIGQLEVTIDYPEEDLEDLTKEAILSGLDKVDKALSDLLNRSETGRIIKEGFRTVIVGKPNAGKSSLLNALLREERAIVTDIPGTTRDTIEETVHIGRVPLVLIDTAGLHSTDNPVERIGIERTRQFMERADLVILVIDGSDVLDDEEEALLMSLQHRRAVLVVNKYDLPLRLTEAEWMTAAGTLPSVFLSARYGSGLETLEETLRAVTAETDMEAARTLYLTNLRHVDLARKAWEAVRRAKSSAEENMPADCIVVDLTEAWQTLGEITGETVDDDLIDTIFRRFCVGK